MTASIAPSDLSGDVEALLRDALQEHPESIVILPVRVDEGVGVYRDIHLLSVKELRANDVDARFLHGDPEDRRFLSEFSAELAATIALGVASNASWDAIKMVAAYVCARAGRGGGKDTSVKVSVSVLEQPDGTRLTTFDITGPSADAAQTLIAELGRRLGLSD